MRNSTSRGQIRTLIFKHENTWYGAALELNIVTTSKDKWDAMLQLDEAIRGYVETAGTINLDPKALNQKAAPEYEKLWKKAQRGTVSQASPEIYSSGFVRLPALKVR